MAKIKKESKEKKGLATGKIILIVIIVFTFIPITIMSMLYFSNNNFKFIANNYLGSLPGSIGQYFNQFPTRDEREVQKREVAKYLIEIDPLSAADKLIIIQNTDSELYSDLIKLMSQLNSKQTKITLERIRESSIKQDILVSTISQMKNDELNLIREKSQYYEKMGIVEVVAEINSMLLNEKTSYKDIANVMEQMKEENAAEILSKLHPDVTNRILSNIGLETKSLKLGTLVNNIHNSEKQLISVAEMYNMENSDKIFEDLGSNKKYKINELSVIYRNMDKIKASWLLSKIEDKNFVYSLMEKIKDDEILNKGLDLLTPELIYGTSIYEEYDRKVSDFVNIASKMENDKILEMIDQLYRSSKSPKKYVINEDDTIIITDQDLAIRVLSEIQPKIAAEVLSKMEPSIVSEISKKISLPSF